MGYRTEEAFIPYQEREENRRKKIARAWIGNAKILIAEYPDLRLKSVYIPEYGITTSDSNALHRVELELELKLRQLEKKQIERIEKNKEYQEKERAREERIRKHPWTKWF